MASDINKVILIGRLTGDPVLNTINTGMAVVKFSIASNNTYSSNGEKKENVSFFNCVAWAKLAEIITEYCKKGHRVCIEGRLSQSRWEAAGVKRSAVEVVVDNFQFLQPKDQAQRPPEAAQTGVGTGDNLFENASPFNDDDIPF